MYPYCQTLPALTHGYILSPPSLSLSPFHTGQVDPSCNAAGTIFYAPASCPNGFYNPSLSSSKTFTNVAMNWQHVYGDWSGTAVGTYLKDTFTIGCLFLSRFPFPLLSIREYWLTARTAVTLTQAQFGLTTTSLASSSSSYGFPFGILGLSFSNGYNNIVDEFKLQGKINSRLFGLGIGAGSAAGITTLS